eukprot:1962343-Rhodomonas_salina.1
MESGLVRELVEGLEEDDGDGVVEDALAKNLAMTSTPTCTANVRHRHSRQRPVHDIDDNTRKERQSLTIDLKRHRQQRTQRKSAADALAKGLHMTSTPHTANAHDIDKTVNVPTSTRQ